jgi:membrane protease YdiL (CAAX protease family)
MELAPKRYSGSEKPAPWGPIAAFLTVFIGYQLTAITFYLLTEYLPDSVKESLLPDSDAWATLVYQTAGVLPIIVAICIAVFLLKGKLSDLGFKKSRISLVLTSTLTVFAGYILVTIVISSLLAFVLPENVLNAEQDLGIETDFSSMATTLPLMISVLVLAPITEEIIFRGFIFKGLRSKFSFWTAAIVSSLAFAAVHLQWNVAFDVFILAIGAAWLMERTGSIYAAILLHVIKNSVAIMLLATNTI